MIELGHLSEAQKRAYVLADNRLAERAGWDRELLALEVGDLGGARRRPRHARLRGGEIDALLNAGAARPARGGDARSRRRSRVSRPGDLWLLGPHRLLCGSATDPAAVARLLGGVRPHLMATDPPYGVSYDPAWRNRAGRSATKRTGKVLNDDRADWREAWALFPGEVAYVWHGALHATTVAESLEACGFAIRSQIIWAKERLVLCRGDYHWQHEPCWYAVREKGKGHWNGDRKQTTLWQIPSRDQDAATVHGTQKPVECMRRPMLNNSAPGQAVYEPFLGSGTSVIAAETCGRICLAMELDPAYVDVAVTRWQTLHRRDRDARRRRADAGGGAGPARRGRGVIACADAAEADGDPPTRGQSAASGLEPRTSRCRREASRRCPEHLSPAAQAEWRRLAQSLQQDGLLTQVDRAALAAYCQSYGRWVEAEQKLAGDARRCSRPRPATSSSRPGSRSPTSSSS